MKSADPKRKAAFGDFQTPLPLAREVCWLVEERFGQPRSVLEPTCGSGSFLVAAHERFGDHAQLVGADVDPAHLERARASLPAATELRQDDFFRVDWPRRLRELPAPLFVIGNPPWVTSAELGALGASNLPTRSAQDGIHGLDALTGRSNFDISEWMGARLLEGLAGLDAAFALLLKTATARKLLAHAWKHELPIERAAIHRIDARKHFGAAVEACLLSCRTGRAAARRCPVFSGLAGGSRVGTVGMVDDTLIADAEAWERTASLAGDGAQTWRSGIKHDCARVLELRETDAGLVNGLGEAVDVEPELLYPLLKSTDVARGRLDSERWLLLPQRGMREDPGGLERSAPRAWAYLERHRDRFERRKSRIYRDRPAFSVFGVGPYSFTPWKVAISGLHKQLTFRLVPPRAGRPVVFDDTVYFLPCATEAEAREHAALLDSKLARDFFSAFIFWDAKRPITARLLRKLDLAKLAAALEA